MKNLIKRTHFALYILLTVGFLSACTMGEFSPRIEQNIEPSLICDEIQLKTIVWHHRAIVWCKYDPVCIADSTFIEMRYKQAEDMVKRIKACR